MHVIVAAILMLAQPGLQPEIYPVPLSRPEAEAMVDSLGRDYVAMKAGVQPHWATSLGVPGHGGSLARYTQRDVSRSLRRVFGIKRKLESFAADSLSISGWVDREALLAEISAYEYWFSGQVTWRRSPLPYTDAVIEGIVSLMLAGDRDSLSLHLASRLAAIPDVVADARANVTDPISLHCEVAAADIRAFTPYLDMESLESADREGLPRIDTGVVTPEALAAARESLSGFASFIDSLAAAGSAGYALGEEAYAEYLRTAFMLDEPLEDLISYAGQVLEQAKAMERAKPEPSRQGPVFLYTGGGGPLAEYEAAMMRTLDEIERLGRFLSFWCRQA